MRCEVERTKRPARPGEGVVHLQCRLRKAALEVDVDSIVIAPIPRGENRRRPEKIGVAEDASQVGSQRAHRRGGAIVVVIDERVDLLCIPAVVEAYVQVIGRQHRVGREQMGESDRRIL